MIGTFIQQLIVLLTKSEANTNDDFKPFNLQLLSDLLFGPNDRLRQDLLRLKPFPPKDDIMMNPNGMAFNYNQNIGPKRGLPIGGFAPNMWNEGIRFGGHGQQHYPPMGGHHSSPMLSHVMPHTFNLINSLRAGLSAGIPSYGFGYGVINDGFMSSNQAMPFYPPIRSGSSSPELKGDERVESDSSPKGTNRKVWLF